MQASGVDGVVLDDHALARPERVQRRIHVRRVDLEHGRSACDELLPPGIDMTLIRERIELVQRTGLSALGVIAGDAERTRQAIGGLETHAAHVEGQAVGKALDDLG